MPLEPTPATEQVALIPLALVAPSPFNPRSASDTARLADLADSIRTSGLQQPIVVRSNAVAGEDGYEIVFGHRRALAARSLGWENIPAIVRPLTDGEVVVAQAIENLQREDLSPLDEARGYRQLLDTLGCSVDAICERVGRKRTQVYARLKLLELVPEGVEALESGTIDAEVAQLVARIPLPRLQLKALAAIDKLREGIHNDRKPSYREIRCLLLDEFTLELRKTIFPLDDAELVPAAGTCLACPKRSGANLDLFGDIVEPPKSRHAWDRLDADHKGPEICTDPDCFAAKKAAQLARAAAELEAKGRTVVAGAAARRALKKAPSWEGGKLEVRGDYVALADVKAELKKAKDKGKEVATVTLQDPGTGKTVQAVKRADLAAAGVKVKEEKKAAGYDWQAESRKRDEERARKEEAARIESAVRRALFDKLRTAIAAAPRSAFDLGLVARAAFAGVEYSARDALARLWGCKSPTELSRSFGSAALADLNLFVMDCALVNDLVVDTWRQEPAEALHAAARHYQIDAAALRKETVAALEAADADARKKQAEANARAKKGKK